jgi:chemotaxis-related protein WspD
MSGGHKYLPVKNENCWKEIGVFSEGNAVCPELKQVIHCRNCEVFTQAGRKFLERDLTDEYRNEWTEVISHKKEEEDPKSESVMIFRVGREWLALSTRVFEEVLDPGPCHTIPHNKNKTLMGIVNVHGEVRLCFSIKILLEIEDAGAADLSGYTGKGIRGYQRMLVVQHKGERWVFPVDEIQGIQRIKPSKFQNIPVNVARSAAFTKNIFFWEDRQIAFLDDERLLYTLARSLK